MELLKCALLGAFIGFLLTYPPLALVCVSLFLLAGAGRLLRLL